MWIVCFASQLQFQKGSAQTTPAIWGDHRCTFNQVWGQPFVPTGMGQTRQFQPGNPSPSQKLQRPWVQLTQPSSLTPRELGKSWRRGWLGARQFNIGNDARQCLWAPHPWQTKASSATLGHARALHKRGDTARGDSPGVSGLAAGSPGPGEYTSPLEPGWQIMWLVTKWLYRMSRVVEIKPQLWQMPAVTGTTARGRAVKAIAASELHSSRERARGSGRAAARGRDGSAPASLGRARSEGTAACTAA